MDTIAGRLAGLRARIDRACESSGRDPHHVALLAVSKTFAADAVRDALAAGQSEFGENRIQELVAKAGELIGTAVRWHMIGSVQTNKVDALLALEALTLVHSVDRLRLVERLDRACAARGRELDVLVQLNAAAEGQKHGAEYGDLLPLARAIVASSHLRLCGLMAMGPTNGDPAAAFATASRALAEVRDATGQAAPILSLGMSGDLEAAIAAGSTLVRVGSAIFGARA